MFIAIVFFALLTIFLFSSRRRIMIVQKSLHDWVLDLLGLSIQGTLIPLLQTFVLAALLRGLFPDAAGHLELHPILAFLLNFVVVDYLYYWNHRLLHSHTFWPFHRVHHSVSQFDILATSRNSVWSSFLILYVWVNSLALFILKDPTFYILGLSLTAVLDLWRHAELETKNRKLENFLSRYLFIVTPADHGTHHDRRAKFNFGANLNIFDKIHGTYRSPSRDVWKNLGIKTHLSLFREIFYPFDKTISKGEKR